MGQVNCSETSQFAIRAIVNAVLKPGPALETYAHS